ncbi:hypothetical protein Tco_0595504 [Tanacetum coccineum]
MGKRRGGIEEAVEIKNEAGRVEREVEGQREKREEEAEGGKAWKGVGDAEGYGLMSLKGESVLPPINRKVEGFDGDVDGIKVQPLLSTSEEYLTGLRISFQEKHPNRQIQLSVRFKVLKACGQLCPLGYVETRGIADWFCTSARALGTLSPIVLLLLNWFAELAEMCVRRPLLHGAEYYVEMSSGAGNPISIVAVVLEDVVWDYCRKPLWRFSRRARVGADHPFPKHWRKVPFEKVTPCGVVQFLKIEFFGYETIDVMYRVEFFNQGFWGSAVKA